MLINNKVVYGVWILFFVFNYSQGQIVMFPTELKSNLGYFSLAVSTQADVAVDVTCNVTTATSRTEANNTIQSGLTCPRSASNDSWTVQVDNTLALQRILVTLAMLPTARIREVLIVTCCNNNVAASSLVSVDISPNLAINVTGEPAADTVFQNPAYQNLAPCPCDLTANVCDTNCCCDTECTVEQNLVSSCIPGPFGGNFTVDLIEFCGSQEFLLPDWHLFLCIQFLNNPDLGLFYGINTNIVDNVADFNIRLAQNSNLLYTFADFVPGQDISIASGYSNGDPVQVLYPNTEIPVYLRLTQRGLAGQCITGAIVRFQNDSDATCDVTVMQELCSNNTILDINSYLLSTSSIVGGSGAVANLTVEYRCGTASDYVKTSTSSVSATGESLFPPPAGPSTPTTTSCIPFSPIVAGGICENAVVSVTYTMTWNASSITAVQVEIIVANVSRSDVTDSILGQSFRVRFVHLNSTSDGEQVSLSGNPGYELGYPVISGILDATSITRDDSLRIWRPGSSGLCAESGYVAPLFGYDTTSGCQLRLSLSNFGDCAALRQTVEEQQRLLVGTAGYVSRYGNPSLSDVANDWILIDLNDLVIPELSNTSEIAGQCANILAHTHVHLLVTESGRILGNPINEIVGVKVSWQSETWRLRCAGTSTCDALSTDTENFFVTSSVTFTRIPPTGVPALTLSEIADNRTCDRDVTCWPELWAPLNQVFYFTMPLSVARREVEYNLVWSLFVIFAAIGYFLLMLNWNKIGRFINVQFPL